MGPAAVLASFSAATLSFLVLFATNATSSLIRWRK
jgi:hypothetical protein